MQACLDAHTGLPVTNSSLNPKLHIILHNEQLSVRVDKNVLSEIESNARLHPANIGHAALALLLSNFDITHHANESHGSVFVRWVPERIEALQAVSGVIVGYGFAQQVQFCNDLDRIRSQCESALRLTERFPSILAKCKEVTLPPRLHDLLPADSKPQQCMSLFSFLTMSLKLGDPVKYWEDRVARLKDASSKNANEAHDTRLSYCSEVRQCEEASARLRDCLSRSQQIASSLIVDQQSVADARSELEQACNLATGILIRVRAAQSIMAKAQKKGIIHQFDKIGDVFTKWTTDLETFEHAPDCLEAFLVEVRKRRSYHGCIAAFEEMLRSRLEVAKTKENARRHEFQTRFSAHMPSEFRQMLLDPVPAIRIDKRLRACGIPQLDSDESLPIDAWLRENSLELGAASSSAVCAFDHRSPVPSVEDVSTNTDSMVHTGRDIGTDPVQLDDDSVAVAANAAKESQERAQVEELLLSGYQMQLSEVERTKDTQLVVQNTVIMAMLDLLQLPEDFPDFPDCSSNLLDSSGRSQFAPFLAAFESHVQHKSAEQEALLLRQKTMQAEVDSLRLEVQRLQLDLKNAQLPASHDSLSAMTTFTPRIMFSDACSESTSSPLDAEEGELARLRARELEFRELERFNAEMEERLRCALQVEAEAKLERDTALENVNRLEQEFQNIMRELRQQRELQVAPYPYELPPPPPRLANAVPEIHGGSATFAQIDARQQPAGPEPLSPKHIETDNLVAKLLEMGYDTQRASLQETIAAMSVQGNVPALDDVIERLLNS